MQYLRKAIIPVVQYLKDTIPKTQDNEPASLRSEIPAERIELLLNNESARKRGVLDVDG